MTRAHEYVGARSAVRPSAQTSGPPRAYPVRQLVAYQRLIERGERVDPAVAVEEYARAHPDTDLDARSTFGEWRGDSPLEDTLERPGGFLR